MKRREVACMTATILAFVSARAAAEEFVFLEGPQGQNVLRTIPNVAGAKPVLVSGLAPGEQLLAISRRENDFTLFGMTADRLYALDATTGAATPAGPRFSTGVAFWPSDAPGFAFDADGRAWLLRDTGTGSYSIHVQPATGKMTYDNPLTRPLRYVVGDPSEGRTVSIAQFATPLEPSSWKLDAVGFDRTAGTVVRVGPIDATSAEERLDVTTLGAVAGLPVGAKVSAFTAGYTSDLTFVVADWTDGFQRRAAFFRIDAAAGTAERWWDLEGDSVRGVALLGAGGAPTLPLAVSKAVVRIRFASHSGNSLVLQGSVPSPLGGTAGRSVRVDVDGVVHEFVTDRRGRARSGKATFRFVGRPRAGAARFVLTDAAVDRIGAGKVAGVRDDTPTGPRPLPVDVFVDDRAHRATVEVYFVARRNGGTAFFP